MPVRVLVVDDSSFFRRQIEKLLSQNSNLEVIGVAENGQDAIEKTLALKPDVITMDIEMPVMDGIKATREIMRQYPVPILMFSSLTTSGAKSTLDALEAGAVDFIPKRFEDISRKREEVQEILCAKVLDLAKHGLLSLRSSLSKKSRTETSSSSAVKSKKIESPVADAGIRHKYKLLAIGTSTGGPVALQEILTKLPVDFPLPIVLVQHMPATFTPAFAQRLNQTCNITVKEAEQGDVLNPGVAYLAPGGQQMEVISRGGQYVIEVKESDPNLTYKPSVDITFTSLSKTYKNHVLGIILTGMGADGCEGSKKLKESGSTIWAQDKASCVVYGMPSAVFAAGITDKVLPLKEFSSHIIKQI
jgi:two-component system chemotaxis response regulator CheB